MLGDLGKLIVAKGFKNLPKVQKIARSGHTGPEANLVQGEGRERERDFLPKNDYFLSNFLWRFFAFLSLSFYNT